MARRRAKIASRKLAGSSFEYGINLEFPAYVASAELEWSALRNSTGLDGADRVVVVESKARPEYNISAHTLLSVSKSKEPRLRVLPLAGKERSSLDGVLFESYGGGTAVHSKSPGLSLIPGRHRSNSVLMTL